MLRAIFGNRILIPFLMGFQVVPLLLFPPASYTTSSQEWWLPALLTSLVIVALVQILFRRSEAEWPWHLLSFAQGFNIISRLLMLMPHAMIYRDGVQTVDTLYIALASACMLFSAFEIWFIGLPEVKKSLLT